MGFKDKLKQLVSNSDLIKNSQIRAYLKEQDTFIRSIGSHMRFGVDELAMKGKLEKNFINEWEQQLKAMKPAERGQFLLDYAHWQVLGTHSGQDFALRKHKHPDALPFGGHEFILPEYMAGCKVFNSKITFTEEQALEFLEYAFVASQQRSRYFSFQPKYLVAALSEVIIKPDQNIATKLRNSGSKMRWALPLLNKLCPIAASLPKLPQASNNEEQTANDKLFTLLCVLKRLPGMWIEVPAEKNGSWGKLNHQLSSYDVEICPYLDAAEDALLHGFGFETHQSKIAELYGIAQSNLKKIEDEEFSTKPLKQISDCFPVGEAVRDQPRYVSAKLNNNDEKLFHTNGSPKIQVIINQESKWLEERRAQFVRILSIKSKRGVAAKLIDIFPSQNTSTPTANWISKADAILGKNDLDEILQIIQRPHIFDDMLQHYEPEYGLVEPHHLTVSSIECYVWSRTRELCALAWAAHLAGEKAAEPLYSLASQNYTKVPGTGPKNEKLANAAAVSLSLIEGGAGVTYLLRLQREVKYPKIKKLLDQRIAEASKRKGVSKQAMEEQAVVDHGFA